MQQQKNKYNLSPNTHRHLSSSVTYISAVCLSLLCLACTPSSEDSVPNKPLKPLVYCSEGSPDGFNPQLVTSGTSYDATANTLYNRLVEYKDGTTELEPALATHWDISDDGLRYRFYLREDVAFHSNTHFSPTRLMNADDVLFSFNRQRLAEHPFHEVSGGNYPYFQSQGLSELLSDIIKVDDHTVEFVLSRPESPFLSVLATPFASVFSAEYGNALLSLDSPELMDSAPIGTGPFTFSRYEPDATIRYKAFSEYFKNKNSVSPQKASADLVYAITPDPAMRFARFSAGECDVMSYPLPVHLKVAQVNNIPRLQVAGLNVAYWAFNVEKPPFNDPKVRQALALAVNREAILSTVYDNEATLASGPIPPTSWAYNEGSKQQNYNLELAKRLLEESDVSDDLTIDIWAMPIQRAYNPNARKMAEMIQQDLKMIGVNVNIISYEWGTFLSLIKRGAHQSVLLGWSADNSDPSNFFGPLLSCNSVLTGNNYAKWCDNQFDSILEQARQSSDIVQQKELYGQAQTIVQQQTPWLSIAHANQSILLQPYVQGLNLSPMGNINFYGVTADQNSPKASNTSQPYGDKP